MNARFQSQIKSRSGVRCQICDGSSDVFTLFVVFLFMNSLEQTTNALTFLSYPQIRTSEHVNSNQAESTSLFVCVCLTDAERALVLIYHSFKTSFQNMEVSYKISEYILKG